MHARRLQSKADSVVLAPIMLVDNETCTLPERRDPFATSSVSCSLRAIASRRSFIIAAQAVGFQSPSLRVYHFRLVSSAIAGRRSSHARLHSGYQ
jgi:hypothetical protein